MYPPFKLGGLARKKLSCHLLIQWSEARVYNSAPTSGWVDLPSNRHTWATYGGSPPASFAAQSGVCPPDHSSLPGLMRNSSSQMLSSQPPLKQPRLTRRAPSAAVLIITLSAAGTALPCRLRQPHLKLQTQGSLYHL